MRLLMMWFFFALCVFSQLPSPWGAGSAAGVGGASNLTTAGAIPYVSAPGALNQDATALFWDAANDRLGIGTNTPPVAISLVGADRIIGIYSNTNTTPKGGVRWYLNNQTLSWGIGSNQYSTNDLEFHDGSAIAAVFKATTRNLLIGTTTDSNFKLDVATSGSAGTARFYDQTAPTGVTRVVVRAGAGQSTTNLQEWQDSAGNVVGRVMSNSSSLQMSSGFVSGGGSGSFSAGYYDNSIDIASGWAVKWSSTSAANGTKDLSLSRASAGVLQVGDGGSNANGQVSATRVLHAGVLVAALPAAAAGNAGSIQYVTDANATTIGSTVAGGGANKVMVWSDGAAWKIFAN